MEIKCSQCGEYFSANKTSCPICSNIKKTTVAPVMSEQESHITDQRKKCKYCSMMIPATAKKCPHCGKILGWTLPAKIGLGFVILVIMGQFITHNEPSSTASKNSIKSNIVLTTDGATIKDKHPEWSNTICNAIANKKVLIGMDKEQVLMSWGAPFKINTSTNAYGEYEQWVMGESLSSDYLYFRNGILSTIQQSH